VTVSALLHERTVSLLSYIEQADRTLNHGCSMAQTDSPRGRRRLEPPGSSTASSLRPARFTAAPATALLTGRSNGGGGSEGCGDPLIPLILSAANSTSLLSTAMNLPPSHSCRRSGPPSLTLQRIVGGESAGSTGQTDIRRRIRLSARTAPAEVRE
jgi:hypothetical protein